MTFEKDKINMTQYETPYGELLVGIHTRDLRLKETEDRIDVNVSYELDVNGDKVADCSITMQVKSHGAAARRSGNALRKVRVRDALSALNPVPQTWATRSW